MKSPKPDFENDGSHGPLLLFPKADSAVVSACGQRGATCSREKRLSIDSYHARPGCRSRPDMTVQSR